MALKIFRSIFGSIELEITGQQWEQITPLPQVKRTGRKGMDKNFRVGKIKRVSDDRSKILVDVLEMCSGEAGDVYEARYNMWVNFDKEWKAVVTKDLTGKYIVFGFYMQSFRNKDMSDSFENVFTCRFINMIPTEEEARSLAIDLMESRLFVDHPFLKLSNVKF